MPRCPVCDKPVSLETTPNAPFCSERCRLVDLGRWLDESQAIPVKKRSLGLPGDLDDLDTLEGDDDAAAVASDEPPDE